MVEAMEWPDWVTEADSGDPLTMRHFKPIVPIVLPIALHRGAIRVLKIYNRFANVPADLKKWPNIPGYERYNVCKNSGRYQELSPMLLGPVLDEHGRLYACNIEDAWQCSKVWPEHLEAQNWFPLWQEWSRRGRFSRQARRHRNPKNSADEPLFSYYMGQQLLYREARRRMYMRWYAQLAPLTLAYQDLKARHLAGRNLVLLDFDGLKRPSQDLTPELLRQLEADETRPFGHGLCLAALLMDVPLD